MVVLSAALLVGAVYLGRRLAAEAGAVERDAGRRRLRTSSRCAIVMLVLPTIDETPGPLLDDAGSHRLRGFPADDLYEFRLFSLGTQVVIWATIGLVFACAGGRSCLARASGRRRILGVSEVVRLTLVSHAMTDAMAAGRFPTDEPLNAVGHRQVDAVDRTRASPTPRYCGPEKRARQTAELLGLQRRHRHAAGGSGLRPLARRRARRGGLRRPGDLADRPDARTARRRVGGRR